MTVLLICGGVFAWRWWRDYPVRKFGVVEAGRIYRSAQPTAGGWRILRDRYHIRTVIDLRENAPGAPWAILEKQFCLENGIRQIRLPVGAAGLTDEELDTVVRTLCDPACQPVLVHCELGKVRTGLAVAAYRIVAQSWSYEAAIQESQQYKHTLGPRYTAYLQNLAAKPGKRLAASLPVGTSMPGSVSLSHQ